MDLRNGDADLPGFRHLPSLDHLTRLTALNLADNSFVRMPDCLNKLKALSYLDLSLNADLQVSPTWLPLYIKARNIPLKLQIGTILLPISGVPGSVSVYQRFLVVSHFTFASPCSIYSPIVQGFSWLPYLFSVAGISG